ncbi:hypothetical protein [Shimia sediminis]|uniref:hypothetical protein n=1 Tax=Shimia sediminis TaxID=2497945 RepID=UPI000F8E3551|nr:hypothetical protein [Shimia sediminis]
MQLRHFTQTHCPELADFLDHCCEAPLRFEGDHPLMHSSDNHIHLWALEYWADHHGWIDTGYRVRFAEAIFARWRARLKGMRPYQGRGYRLYLYADLAPTVSVVAETDVGCPYGLAEAFAPDLASVMRRYAGQSWAAHFGDEGAAPTPQAVLKAVERHHGSISKPTAQALGMQVGHLRRFIEWFELADEVNVLRKRHKRRPVQFREEHAAPLEIWEERLPAGY